jgi:hypothetical protein
LIFFGAVAAASDLLLVGPVKATTADVAFINDVHLIWSRKVPLVIVNHEVINIMSPIGSLVIVWNIVCK